MHDVITEMNKCVHISVTKWCIVGYWSIYIGMEDIGWKQNETMFVTDCAFQIEMLSILNFKHVAFYFYILYKLIRTNKYIVVGRCSEVQVYTQIAKFMGPTWGPPGSCRPQMLAPCWPHEPCYQGCYLWRIGWLQDISWQGNTFNITGPWWGEFTGHWSVERASVVKLWCFLCC